MNRIDRDISFPLTRMLANDFAPEDAEPLSVDFSAGIFVREGRRTALSDAISTTRSGDALMAAADGSYRTFDANEPPFMTGVGLDVYRQIAPLLHSSADLPNGSYWTVSNGSAVKNAAAPDGTTNATTFTEDASNGYHGFVGNTPNRPTGVAGTRYTSYACVGKNQTRRYVVLWWGSGSDGILATLDTQTGTLTECVVTGGDYTIHDYGIEDAGVSWRVWMTGSKATPYPGGGVIIPVLRGATASSGNGAAPTYPGDGSTIVLWDLNIVAADFPPPPHPTGASLTPRYATTVTDPDFTALVSACGLDSGFRISTRIAFERLSDSAERCIWAAGADADNHTRLELTVGNTARFKLRKAGVDVTVLESEAFVATGDKDIAVTVQDGAWVLTASGVGGDADSGVYGLPALTELRYGSNFGDADYLNGTMRSLVLGRVA